jgi:hypothetical protein
MKKRFLIALLMLCVVGSLAAKDSGENARVAFYGPGGAKGPVDDSKYLKLVLEGPNFSYDSTVIAGSEIVPFVNALLEQKGVSVIAVFVREGSTYGDVVRGIDLLRGTNAKNIGVGMRELPQGRNP